MHDIHTVADDEGTSLSAQVSLKIKHRLAVGSEVDLVVQHFAGVSGRVFGQTLSL